MNLTVSILFMIISAYFALVLAKKIRVPSVVALILLGLIIDISPLKELIIKPHDQIITVMGDIGLISLMIIAGLETNWQTFYKERRDASIIAVSAAVVPFLMGFAALLAMGFSLISSLVAGICLSVTAEATKAKVLLDLDKLKTRVGSAMMGAGIIDDLLGLVSFLSLTYILKQVHLLEDLVISLAIAGFFIGILLQKKLDRRHYLITQFEKLLNILIVPFFFISIGAHFEISSIILNPLLLMSVVSIAVIGKLGGTILVKPFIDFSLNQIYLIGWGMNSRGAIEIGLAMIAFRSGLIPVELYSSLIIMAIVTTLIFPFIITSMIKNDNTIMD